jgi:hypothetical protein
MCGLQPALARFPQCRGRWGSEGHSQSVAPFQLHPPPLEGVMNLLRNPRSEPIDGPPDIGHEFRQPALELLVLEVHNTL